MSSLDGSLRDFSHIEISSILRNLGWKNDHGVTNKFDVWMNETVRNQIILPLDRSKADYAHLLNNAITQLKESHGSDFTRAAHALELVAFSKLDSTKWTRETPVKTGLIPWNLGEGLVAAVRLALTASAKATHEPRAYFGQASAFIAREFLDRALMGQTEVGSFVVTAHVPTDAQIFVSEAAKNRNTEGQLFDAGSVTGRDILGRMEFALGAATDALRDYENHQRIEVFDEIVSSGFSYELSTALAKLTEPSDSTIQITSASDSSKIREKSYSFESRHSKVLEQASERLSLTRETAPVRLRGEVTLLERVPTESEHSIRLHISNHPGVNKIRLNLKPEQYDIALAAHREDQPIEVDGLLMRRGNRWWLSNPDNIRILNGETAG